MKTKLLGLPKGGCKVVHFIPHAYCLAKPGEWCAVFAVPPETMELGPSCLIQNKSVKNIKIGDWISLAYIGSEIGGEIVAVPYQPEFELRTK